MMPRDMDLIRQLMLRFEKNITSIPEGRTELEVAYHVKQMIDAGLIDGQVIMAPSPGKRIPRSFVFGDITWRGHDFIEAIRNDTVWARTKEHFIQKSASWTLDLIVEFLKSHGRAALGLGVGL